MPDSNLLAPVVAYYEDKLAEFGSTARGVDWKDEQSQELRFAQLVRALGIQPGEQFSVIDYGCGWGALLPFLSRRGHSVRYFGYDPSARMIAAARSLHSAGNADFFSDWADVPAADYVMASGVFNVRLKAGDQEWSDLVVHALREIDGRARAGWSANFLTRYSDADRMRADLHYADPSFLFDWCRRSASQWVSLLHDYELWEFTLGVLRQPFRQER